MCREKERERVLTDGLAVVPATEVHPLSDEFDGGLGAVHLPRWHVEVVDEEDKVLAKGRAKHTLTPVTTACGKYSSVARNASLALSLYSSSSHGIPVPFWSVV